MTSTFPTKKDCVGYVPSSSGASEAPASAQTSLTREESRVGVDVRGAPTHPGNFQRKRWFRRGGAEA